MQSPSVVGVVVSAFSPFTFRLSPFTFHPPSPYHRRRGLSLKAQLRRFEGVFLGHSGFSSVEAIKN
jgi:hypothetical protein